MKSFIILNLLVFFISLNSKSPFRYFFRKMSIFKPSKKKHHYGFLIHSFKENKKMKLFNVILTSNFLFLNWVFLYCAPNILRPSHQLYSQYSMFYNQQPKNVDTSNSYLTSKTSVIEAVKFFPSFFHQYIHIL